jgi:hypothetical protein
LNDAAVPTHHDEVLKIRFSSDLNECIASFLADAVSNGSLEVVSKGDGKQPKQVPKTISLLDGTELYVSVWVEWFG